MAEIGMSMEPPKKGFVEGLKRAFTVKGAKEKWYQDHAELVKKYSDVNNGLTDEQRTQVMQKIDDDATKSAKINVGTKVAAVSLVTSVVGLGGALIGIPKFREWAGGLKLVGKSLEKFGDKGAAKMDKAKQFVLDTSAKMYDKVFRLDKVDLTLDKGAQIPSPTKK